MSVWETTDWEHLNLLGRNVYWHLLTWWEVILSHFLVDFYRNHQWSRPLLVTWENTSFRHFCIGFSFQTWSQFLFTLNEEASFLCGWGRDPSLSLSGDMGRKIKHYFSKLSSLFQMKWRRSPVRTESVDIQRLKGNNKSNMNVQRLERSWLRQNRMSWWRCLFFTLSIRENVFNN